MKDFACIFTTLVLLSSLADCGGSQATVTLEFKRARQPSQTSMPSAGAEPTALSPAGQLDPIAPSSMAQEGANEEGDQVTRDELRATSDPNAGLNSVWDGASISLFGAGNEVAAFSLVLEAPTSEAVNVNVRLMLLTGSGGASITSVAVRDEGVFAGREALYGLLLAGTNVLAVDRSQERVGIQRSVLACHATFVRRQWSASQTTGSHNAPVATGTG